MIREIELGHGAIVICRRPNLNLVRS
jgi:hypothetical protein